MEGFEAGQLAFGRVMGQMVNGEPSVVNKLQGFYVERTQATRLVTRTPFHIFSWIMLTAAPVLASVNLIKIFTTTDFVGQAITVGLALFSIVAWTVMFGKFSELKRLRELNLAFEQRLRDERTLLDLPESFRTRRSIPYADVYADAFEAYWRAASILQEKGIDSGRARLEHAENGIQRAIARQTLRYESSMIFLASIVSGAPFLGLFGTVWGVMEVFQAVSTQTSANLQTLAPGVSAALMTTIAGLVVAIPAVFGYNVLLTRTRQLATELENYASVLADRLELESR
jgi:biopolymer transport protein TolQ